MDLHQKTPILAGHQVSWIWFITYFNVAIIGDAANPKLENFAEIYSLYLDARRRKALSQICYHAIQRNLERKTSSNIWEKFVASSDFSSAKLTSIQITRLIQLIDAPTTIRTGKWEQAR